MIIGSLSFICVFAVLIKVSLQVTGIIGGSVLLPCSLMEHLQLQDITVFWRHNDSIIVFDIINGNGSVAGQYKNRVESFHKDYVNGNYSIKLNKLQHSDAGEFSCLISHSDEPQTVQLIIEESTSEENQEAKADNVENWVVIVIAAVIAIAATIAAIISIAIIYKRKKSQTSSFSSVSTGDVEEPDK
ncbi:hypothetical protein QQF64_018931 [Cirrhinus molitorella]|uniref:Ig-like domain-containing protein n=1 Tax=Cirrhinus molitorella TaxID=172907 RepID=A0ABR3LE42_9TELE